jgi:hypothetical protein
MFWPDESDQLQLGNSYFVPTGTEYKWISGDYLATSRLTTTSFTNKPTLKNLPIMRKRDARLLKGSARSKKKNYFGGGSTSKAGSQPLTWNQTTSGM